MTNKERAKIKAELRQEIKNRKLQKTDGLGAYEIKKIRAALRQVWQRSHARRLVVARCTDNEGFTFCEKCRKRTPALKIDHLIPCGDVVDGGYIKRLFIESRQLQGLCKTCHDAKTKLERQYTKLNTVKKSKWGF